MICLSGSLAHAGHILPKYYEQSDDTVYQWWLCGTVPTRAFRVCIFCATTSAPKR